MISINVEIDEIMLKKIIINFLSDHLTFDIEEKDVKFLVMTKQNYKATEWENGKFKVIVERKEI